MGRAIRIRTLKVRTLQALCLGLFVVFTMASAACKSRSQAYAADVWIAQAEGIMSKPKGKAVAIVRGQVPKKVTEEIFGTSKDVLLAVARDVRWHNVRDLRKALIDQGRVPHLLVANSRKVGAFKLRDTLVGEPIRVYVSVGGKLCVAPPNSIEARCVQRGDRKHVDRAFTRESVREAVNAYNLHDVLVDVPADLDWADVVRAIDGARTCCFEDVVRVRLK